VHLTSSPIDWYAARAAGFAAYLLLTTAVLLGLTMAAKRSSSRWPRFAVEDVHRFAGLLVGAFVAVHVITVAIDAWLPFSVASLLVPLLARYRPVWVGLGVAAAELLVALAVTNHYRRRLPYRFWRRAHYLNFAVWGAATLHGLGSGTDRSAPWALALYAAATSVVAGGVAWRLGRHRLGRPQLAPLPAVLAATSTAVVVALAIGPLRFRPSPWNAATFSETLTGHIARLNGVSKGIVSLAGEGVGRQRVLVRADLLLSQIGVEKTSFQMEYLPSAAPCTGSVTNVQSYGFSAVCRLVGGARRFIVARWQQGDSSELSGGVISAHP
jgi:sulfoxide reductase heme-binding subunit YedZ